MGGVGAPMPSWLELWNEWEIQVVVIASFSLQVILFFFAGIRRYSVSFVLKALLWLVYLLADVVATYALGHMSSSLSRKSSSEHQLVAFWAPFLLLHLGGQDTITAYALEDNELWLRHLLNMFVQVTCTAYVLYKYISAGGATFVHASMLVLAAGVFKYGERIRALKLASKGGRGSRYIRRRPIFRCRWFYLAKEQFSRLADIFLAKSMPRIEPREGRDCFTKNKQFRTYVFTVMTAHALRHGLVKPLIIDRNEASISRSDSTVCLVKMHAEGCPWQDNQSEDASAKEKRTIGELYKGIEVQLALMYDMLYTKAEVIHTRYGHFIRAISLVSCFAALVVFTKSKRDGYSTPDIVITFALLGGACALEMASAFKAIGSTWTCAILRPYRLLQWLANAILFARYHLVVVKDGRWSDSVGQFNLLSFCVHSRKTGLKGRIAHLIGLRDLWNKARCTKHVKLSPILKEFVWGLLKGDKRHMVQIQNVAFQSGYLARSFSGFAQSEELDWSMSCEFQESVLVWHIATSTFLNHPDVKPELVDKDMVEAVNTLSDYMVYLIVEHPNIVPVKADARRLFHQTCKALDRYTHDDQTVDEAYTIIREGRPLGLRKSHNGLAVEVIPDDLLPGQAVLKLACKLAQILLRMKLGITYKMIITVTVWTEMLRYAATNASDGFHARQLSNGGEFLTHILLLTKYAATAAAKAPDETVEDSSVGHVEQTVDDGCNDEINELSLV